MLHKHKWILSKKTKKLQNTEYHCIKCKKIKIFVEGNEIKEYVIKEVNND